MKLPSARTNEPYVISIVEESELKSRLYEMGLYPNQVLHVKRKAPFGDPYLVEVEGNLVMLRSEEANLITLQETDVY